MFSKLIKSSLFIICMLVANQLVADEIMSSSVQFPSSKAETNLSANSNAYNWSMSATPPKFTIISNGDINVPIQISTGEFTLSDPKVGLFKFFDGQVSSVTRTAVNRITQSTQPICSYSGCTQPPAPNQTAKFRPTIFISIQGFSSERSGVDAWQTEKLDLKLMNKTYNMHYKHFAIDWDSARQILPQAKDAVDLLKAFLNSQDYPWNVVLIGYSRGGIFAHEMAGQLAGNSKINKLHVLLLDPTAAPIFGDIYPITKAPGTLGYLKYDNRSWVGTTAGTISDKPIAGYDNYNAFSFITDYSPTAKDQIAHENYALNWVDNDFENVLSKILETNDTGYFAEKESSGMDIWRISTKNISATISTQCSGGDTGNCTVNGELTLGVGSTVSISNVISTNGVDISVASAAGAATAIVRQDQITLEQSDTLSKQSVAIDQNGIRTRFNLFLGPESQTKIDKNGGSINISVNGNNIVSTSIGPLDAIIPGASQVKSSLKKLAKKLHF